MNYRHSIGSLAMAHLLCGLVLGYLAERGSPEIFLAIYIGLIFSQTSLIGIWGGLAKIGWPTRLIGVTLGIAFLSLHLCFSLDNWQFENLLIVFVSTVVVAAVMLIIHRFVARLRHTMEESQSEFAEGLQFSIRHLMLLTLVVSFTLAVGRWLQPYFEQIGHLTFLLTICLCFVSVGLSATWALLGRGYLILRSGVVLIIATLTACILTFIGGRSDFWFWLIMMMVEATVLLASLFAVRRCGFRLTRIS